MPHHSGWGGFRVQGVTYDLPAMKRLLLLCCILFARCALAADPLLPRPPELEPDVQFWIRVYSEISTNEGFIHDQHRLSVVYETLHFETDTPPQERAHRVDAERERYHDILLRLARGAEPQDADERRVKELWGVDGTPLRLTQATEDIRFQLGQSDRFRAGMVRAGAWETHIGEVLANRGLPAELAALPHVESSFDPYAYSKVGAAGLWQFMRSTGRRFMRIDSAVDERLDPDRASEAAAQLLSYNYRLLGSWPLAITAYNHGAEGMRRAREQLGTDDIVKIVRDYHSPSFGFASRNFYVSFLAALSVSQNPDKYFANLERSSESGFRELKVPSSVTAANLVRTMGIDRDTLRGLNPALRPAVWSGQRSVPAGYVLRVPSAASKWTTELLAQRMGVPSPAGSSAATVTTVSEVQAMNAQSKPTLVATANTSQQGKKSRKGASSSAGSAAAAAPESESANPPVNAGSATQSAAATPDVPQPQTVSAGNDEEYYVVQTGDTVESIAVRAHLPVKELMALNSMRDQDDIYEGQRLRLAREAPESETATTAATVEAAKVAVQESQEEDQALKAAKRQAARTEVVSKAEAQAEGPELVPGAEGSASVDPEDYSVAADGTIKVVAAETLGHYADWLGISASKLRALNHLKAKTPVVMGKRLKLDFKKVTEEEFEQKRRDYHEQLEAAYFASHRIDGTEVYIARKGDSLWSITQRSVKVPVWLLQQYNPDLDFGDLRPGTQISLPKVEDVTGL
jgi:membrane-bound lytic murein transglycosylase D